jgi:hypothetical protein
VNRDNERLIQQLRDELGSLEVPPAPVVPVTQRGRAIRARRRALAAGLAAVVAVALLAARFIGAPGPAPGAVTLNQPNPRAPGGVFASGTANGKPWQLAVRNIAADPGTKWCLPAVMFNGHDGNVLFRMGSRAQAPGGSAFLPDAAFLPQIPRFPGVGAVFTQMGSQDTRLVVRWPNGRQVTARPVWVSACTKRFHLAGFAFANPRRAPSEIATYTKFGLDQGTDLGASFGTGTDAGGASPGVWANLDTSQADMAASSAHHPIGTGTIAGRRWHIDTALGLFGQCYGATLRGGRGLSLLCAPVAAPPRTIVLSSLPVRGWAAQYTGYAGLVNPRAKELVASFDNGTTSTAHPVFVAGRAYVAFVAPPGCQLTQLTLRFAHYATTIPAPPPGQAVLSWPPRGAGKASQRVISGTPVQVTP